MTSVQDQNKSIVLRFNERFIQGQEDSFFDETIAGDFINHSANPGSAPDKAGSFFWFTRVLRPAFPDLEVDVLDQVVESDKVVSRKVYTGTHRGAFLGVEPTGRAVSFTVIDIIRLRDGKYVEHWANADMFALMNQLRAA